MNTTPYHILGGTIRSRDPKETLDRLTPLLPAFGITRVANITGLDNINIPVYTCMRPLAKHLSVSQGKGLTKDLAKISAVMEAIEGYHLENPAPPKIHGNYLMLKETHNIIDPTQFMSGFFDWSNKIRTIDHPWIQARSLLDNQNVLIPHALTNIDSTHTRPEFNYFQISTNGIAAGNSQEEATCHALYEVIERDSFFKWSQKPKDLRDADLISLDSISNPSIIQLIDQIKKASLKIKLWDISSELKVPSFHCAIYNTDLSSPLSFFSGTGTHLNQEIAMTRAITEAVQTRTSLISGARDDIFNDYYYQQNLLLRETIKMAFIDGLKPIGACPQIAYQNSFESNILQLLQIISSNGHTSILWIDHTKPEFNIPVVQVFIPTMQFSGARM